MSYEGTTNSLHKREQSDDQAPATEPALAPGKRTRTMGLASGAGQAPAPVQQKPAASADPARHERAQRTQQWLDTATRPDLHPPPAAAADAVQMHGQEAQPAGDVHQLASAGIAGAATSLPHRDRIQQSFGNHDVSNVQAHVGGPAAEASQAMGAQAYATGSHVAFRETPDLHTAAHEAAHVVQQRAGVQLAGGVGQTGDAYERHADQAADLVARGESAEPLLDQMAGGAGAQAAGGPVQRLADEGGEGGDADKVDAVRNLGDVEGFGDQFYSAAGAVLEAAVPRGGDKARVQININLRVNPSCRISFRFIADAENAGGNFKGRVEVAAGVMTSVDLWVAEAFAQAMAFGYLETQGDSGAEVFRFLSFAIYDRVASVSRRAADYVWGDTFGTTTREQLQGEDYIESGLGIEASAGLSADAGNLGAGAGVRGSMGTRISDGGNQRDDVYLVAGSVAANVNPWSGEVGFKLSRQGEQEAGEISFAGERTVNLLDFTSALETGAIQELMVDWVGSIVGSMQGLILSTSGIDGSAAQRFSSVMRMVAGHSFGVSIGSTAALHAAKQRLADLSSAQVGQKLSIGVGFDGKNVTLQVDLERLSRIEVGDNPRSDIYVLLESVERIIRVGPLNIA